MNPFKRLVLRIRLRRVSRKCEKLREELWFREDVLLGLQLFASSVLRRRWGRPDSVDRILAKLDEELMRCVEEKYRLIRMLSN